MTQENLTELVNIAPQIVPIAELGQKVVRPDAIIKISAVPEVSMDHLLLDKVMEEDKSLLSSKIFELTPNQYRHSEDIIGSFVAVVKEKETQEK